MKIRRDAVAVSAVLFTLALLIQTPAILANVWTASQTRLDIAHHMGVSNYYAFIGFASLAILGIGLIVTWAGYIKGVRWTWLVLFVIAWGWVFPVLVMPEFHWRNMLPITQWPPLRAARNPGLDFAESVVTLLLMVLALVVPIKTFVRANHRWDLKIRRSAVGASGILFTLALLMPTPAMLGSALVTYESRLRDIADVPPSATADQIVIPNWYAPTGITSLAIIAIGLIVTWAAYIRGLRWTWFVMFVIVWLWAFPILVLPWVYAWNWNHTASIPQILISGIQESLHAGPFVHLGSIGIAQAFLEAVVMFLLMLIALVLPVKTLILGHAVAEVSRGK